MTKQEQMLAALMAAQAGNARFGSVDFAGTPVLKALGGEQADIQRRNRALFEPPTGSATKEQAFSRIARALLGRYQKNQEAADTTDLYSKLATPEITDADYEAYSSPYLAEAREAEKRAELASQNQGLGIDAQDLYTPSSLDMPVPDSQASIDPNTGATTYSFPTYSTDDVPLELLSAPSRERPIDINQNAIGLDAAQLGIERNADGTPLFQSQAGTADQYTDTPLGEDPRMMSALIGDPQTVEQERGQIAGDFALEQLAPGALLDRIGGVETRTDAGRNLQQQMVANARVQQADALRTAALLEDEREFQKELKAIGPLAKSTVSIKPVADPNSVTGWSYKNVLDANSDFLGAAQSQALRFDPEAASKQTFQELASIRYGESTEGLAKVDNMLGKIEQMRGLAQRVESGALTDFKTDFMRLGNSLGMSFDVEKIANVEAMRAKGMEFILDIISGTKGAISEKEMDAFEAASPNAGNTQLGNKQILDLAEASAERLKAAHEAARAAYKVEGASVVDLDDAFFKAQEEWGGFGFIFAPENLPSNLKDGWSKLSWQKKKRYYDLNRITY